MAYSTSYKPRIAGFLLFLFAMFFAKTTLFLHVHIVDGVAVVHSHFHFGGCHLDCSCGGPENNEEHSACSCSGHEHTHDEIDLINVLSEFQVLAHSFSTIVPNVDFTFHRFQSAEVAKPQTEFIDLTFPRGPPTA